MRVIRRVANEHMAEAERVVDRLVGADQLLANEGGQLCARWAPAVRRELAERLPLEVEPDDRRSLDDLALLLGQSVEPGGEQSLDRRGHLVARSPPSASIASNCSTKSGFPSATSRMRVRVASSSVASPSKLSTSSSDSSSVSGSSVIASPLHASPRLAQVRSSEAEEENGRVARPVRDVLDEIEQRRLGPVDVLEHERERTRARARSSHLRTVQATSSGDARFHRRAPLVIGVRLHGRSPRAAST